MNSYLESVKKQFEYYKMLGEKTFEQIPTRIIILKKKNPNYHEENYLSINYFMHIFYKQ